MRGLKQNNIYLTYFNIEVAPYVGAWIETDGVGRRLIVPPVAPYVGAWFETSSLSSEGLRPLVAPYVGAWIETSSGVKRSQYLLSHPTWVRGLKL